MAAIKKSLWSYIFVLPMFTLLLVFTIYPIISSVRYTFYNWDGIGVPEDFVGFENYSKIAQDPFFWNAFKNTFTYTGIVVPIQLTLALTLAIILNSRRLRLKNLFKVIFFSPIITSPAIVGIVISLIIISAGDNINHFLQSIGWISNPVDWLGKPQTAIWIVIAVGIWVGLGYPIIYFLASLQAVNAELYDAAKVDGANDIALFWHITIPSIRSIIIVVLLLLTLHSLRVFDIVQVMTKGGPYFATDMVSTYIYRYAFFSTGTGESDANLGFASAAAFFMGLLVMLISVIQITLTRRYTKWTFTDEEV